MITLRGSGGCSKTLLANQSAKVKPMVVTNPNTPKNAALMKMKSLLSMRSAISAICPIAHNYPLGSRSGSLNEFRDLIRGYPVSCTLCNLCSEPRGYVFDGHTLLLSRSSSAIKFLISVWSATNCDSSFALARNVMCKSSKIGVAGLIEPVGVDLVQQRLVAHAQPLCRFVLIPLALPQSGFDLGALDRLHRLGGDRAE